MDTKAYPWAKFYESALLELDQKRLQERAAVAQAEIDRRLYDIRDDPDHHAERRDIDDAIRNLRLLRSEGRA